MSMYYNYISALKDLSIHEFMKNLQYYVKLNDVVFKASADIFYSVDKYAIVDMIKSGLPVYIIKEFTGYKNDICNYCQEIVDGEDGPASRQEKNRMLDSIFRKSNLSDVY